MKPFHLLFLLLSFTVLYVQAQRRTTSTTTENARAATSRSPARSRGRSRFTLTQEFKESHELSSTTEPTFKHISPRKRVSDFSISRETKSKPQSAKHNYEVQEIVNESPIDSFKRQSKPRVLTETIFEASSTSKSTTSEEISSTSESTKTSEVSLAEASSTEETYTAANSEHIETPSAELSLESQEISRTQPISTTAKTTQEPTKSSRRSNGRRASASEEVTTFSSRSRARSRAIEAAPSARGTRTPKRRSESSTLLAEASRRGPSVFDAPQTDLKSRPGRRIDTASIERNTGRSSVSSTERSRSRSGRRLEALRPEKITLDIPKEQPPSRSKTFPSRNSGGQIKNKDTTTPKTFPSRGGKFRTRTTTPVIDEQKLEVLPLFETEPKTVQPPTRSRSRTKERRDSENEVVTVKPSRRLGRTRNLKSDTEDPLQASSTETDIQFQKPEVSSQVTVSVESKTEASTRRRHPQIKESVVISQVSEVTSKKVVTRRKNTVTNDAGEKVKLIGKIVPRGKKKSEVKLNEAKRKSDDSEEVDESDNYPEPFKALIQAKKTKKESRPTASSSPSERLKSSSPTPVMVTSIVTSSSSASAEVTKEYHDLDNELIPRVAPTTFKPTTRPIRNRFSLTTKIPDTTPLESDKKTKSPSRKPHRSRTTTQSPSTSSFTSRDSRGPTTYAPRTSSTALHSSRESRISSTVSPTTTQSPSTSSLISRESRGPTTHAPRSSSTTSYPSRESRLSSTALPSTSTTFRVSSTTEAHSRGYRFSSTTPAVVRVYPTTSYPSVEPKTPLRTTTDVVRISSTTPYSNKEAKIPSTSTPVYSTGRNSKLHSFASRENKISAPTAFPNRQSTSFFPNRDIFSTTFSANEYFEPSIPSTTSFSSRESNSLPDRGTKLFSPNSFNLENGPLVSTFSSRDTILPGRGSKLLSDTVPIKPNRNSSRERYSGRKKEGRDSRERLNKSVEEPILLSTKIPKSAFVPKKPSDRYRSDLSLRTAVTRTTTNAPAYIPTIPSAPYVPTVPTVTPPNRNWKTSTVPSKRSTKDVDLGLEVLFFDDPVNSIQSANLVKGDYASSKENLLNNPSTPAKGGTTEKTVSIIEQIINSIAANLTSPPPFTSNQGSTSTTTTTESSKSAILKLATKKTKTDNDTDTTDKPTTIIEQILNSLSAIQATDDTNSDQGEQTTASIDTNNLPLESDAGWYTAFQEASNLERGSTIDTSKGVDHVYRIPPRKSKSYSSETSGTIGNNDVGTIPANIFSSILQGVGTTSTGSSRFPEFSFDLGSGTTTTSSVVQIPGSTSKTLGGFWGVNVGVDGTTSSTTTAAASTTTTANYRIIPFNKYNQILNIQDLIRGNDEEISREQVVTVEMTTRPSTPQISTSTTTTKAPTSTTTAVPKVPPTKPVLPQTPFVEEIITVPGISVDAPTTTAVPTTMPTLTTEAATTIAPTTEEPTTAKSTTTTTTTSTTSTSTTTTPKPTTTKIQTVRFISTTPRYTSTPTRVPRPTTTEAPSYVPSFLTTLFPILLTPEPTKAPKYTTTKSNGPEVLSFAASTAQPATVAAIPPRKRTTARTTPAPQKKRRTTTTTTTTTTTPSTTTTRKTTTTEKVVEVQSSTKRSVDLTDLNTISVTAKSTKKKLTPEQKRNLETLMQLEKEQAALLQQLSFLTTLNFGGNNGKGAASALSNTNLASRIAQLTSERSKPTTSSTKSPATSKKTTKQPHSIQDQLAALGVTTPKPSRNTPSLEDVLKQYDLDGVELTTKAPAAKYGTSSDAILASILKEQGIAPPTPKSLAAQIEQAGVFDETTTKRPRPRPRPTAAPPRPRGGLLNWLLNAFAPPPSAPPPRRTKPKPKPKPTKPKKPPVEQELLANSPTHVTPIVTTAPKSPSPNSLSQDDIQKLIKQLEGLQKDPKGQVDLSQVKSLQTLINTDGPGVEVRTNGEHGATSHKPSTTRRPRARKTTTTAEPLLTVAEEDEDDEEFSNAVSTPRSHVRGHTVAPLGFNPVPGVDEDGPGRMIRSNLLTAAVNVTRAMAGFLGTAIQGAALRLSSYLANGSAGPGVGAGSTRGGLLTQLLANRQQHTE